MFDFLFDLGVSVILTVLRESIKNPQRKAEVRRAMLKVWTQIGIVFGADEEFQEVAIDKLGLDK